MKRRDLLKLFVAAPILPYIPTPKQEAWPQSIIDYLTWRHDMESTGLHAFHMQPVICKDLRREQLYELGKIGPYTRYINFPVEATDGP